jgi:succinate--hydroxymethylglutarate CoA-transferase
MLSAGNDYQFKILCSAEVLAREEWVGSSNFGTNRKRVENREEMVGLIECVLAERTTTEWCERLTGKGLVSATAGYQC